MLCKKCLNKRICKHYEYMRNAIELDIAINSCENYSTNLVAEGLATLVPTPMTVEERQSKYPNEVTNSPDVRFKDVSIDYSKVSNEVNKNRITPDFKITAIPTELVTCKNEKCKAKTYEEDLTKCTSCGADVCSACSYTDMAMPTNDSDSIVTTVLCEDCFNKKLNTKPVDKVMEPIKSESFEDMIKEMEEEIKNAPVKEESTKKKRSKKAE